MTVAQSIPISTTGHCKAPEWSMYCRSRTANTAWPIGVQRSLETGPVNMATAWLKRYKPIMVGHGHPEENRVSVDKV